MTNIFDVTKYGAVGDRLTDSTAAIQRAIDDAAPVGGLVFIPPGIYLCGMLKVPPHVQLKGSHGWGYRELGGSVLMLNDPDAPCLLDITGAYGCLISGLQLHGNGLMGKNIHGVMSLWPRYNGGHFEEGEGDDNPLMEPNHCADEFSGGREDALTISDCMFKNFSGDGIHMNRICVFNLIDCHSMANGGNGLYMDGWDGFIHNCNFGTNNGYGISAENAVLCAMNITGNRIEWNRRGGIRGDNCHDSSIVGNWIDRNGGPALYFGKSTAWNLAITGNTLRRNGRPRSTPMPEEKRTFDSPYENSQILMENCLNSTITGNTFILGQDDKNVGTFTPDYSIVYGNCEGCCITGNAMHKAAVKENFLDIGDKPSTIVIANNAQ